MDKDEALPVEPRLANIDVAGIEAWREYDFSGRIYRIDDPVSVEYRIGGTTHRVTTLDDVVHIMPAPGHYGCVVRICPSKMDGSNF